MAGLQELNKRLRSVGTSKQIAGALKTVAAARFSQLGNRLTAFTAYSDAIMTIASRFSRELSKLHPQKSEDAPECFVLLGSPNSLCGSFNAQLLPFASATIAACKKRPKLLVSGSTAVLHLRERGIEDIEELSLAELPTDDDCESLCKRLLSLYTEGEVSSVSFILMRSINSLVAKPVIVPLLPLGLDGNESSDIEPLLLPDRESLIESLFAKVIFTACMRAMLDSAASLQSSTLIAMRSAYDNAVELENTLELRIQQKRQSMITAGVIETAGAFGSEEPENSETKGADPT